MTTPEWRSILSPCVSIRLSIKGNSEVYGVTDCGLSKVTLFAAIELSSIEVLFSKLNYICMS